MDSESVDGNLRDAASKRMKEIQLRFTACIDCEVQESDSVP
jgi:hypothetical protein